MYIRILTVALLYVITTAEKLKKIDNVDIAKLMVEAGIVPKVIPNAPPEMLNVILTRGPLIPGQIIDHDDNEISPSIDFRADNSTWHSLFIYDVQNWDPDEKVASRSYNTTKPNYPQEEWHIWTLVNIPGNNALLGEEYYNYEQPHIDPELEIINLEVFLVYQQPGNITFKRPEETLTKDGNLVKTIREFTEYYNMTGPIAGNFLYRRWRLPYLY